MYNKHEMEIIAFEETDSYVQARLSDGGCLDSATCTSQECPEYSFESLFGC